MHASEEQGKQEEPSAGGRLLAPLPEGEFIDRPEEIDRFIVRVWPGGMVSFKGSRARITEFLALCHSRGLAIDVDHISFCG